MKTTLFFAARLRHMAATGLLAVLPLQAHAQWDMQQFISEVLAHNPGLASLRSSYNAATAHAERAGRWDDPMLSYSLAPNSLGAAGIDDGHIVALSQRLPWPGKLHAERSAAQAQAQERKWQRLARQAELTRQARRLYAAWYEANETIRIQNERIELLDLLLGIKRGHAQVGHGQQRDVLLAKLRKTQAQQALLKLQAQRTERQAVINALRDQAPGTALAEAVLPILPTLPLESADKLQQHPEILALQARIEAARQGSERARLASRPDLSVHAKYVGTMGREENRTQIGLAFKLPFDQGKYRQGEAAASAQQLQWQQRQRQRYNELQAEHQRAVAAWQAATDSSRLYREQLLPLAQQNLELLQADYASGRGSAKAVVEGQDEWLQIQLGLLRSRVQQFSEYANLQWLTGQ